MKESTTKSIWDKLVSLYMAKSVTNKFLLMSRLYNLNFEEGNSLKAHLDVFCTIVMDLHNINVVLDVEDSTLFLLCSLPSVYKNFRDTFTLGIITIW